MVAIFKALSEQSRLRILSLLLEHESCVCEIEACLGMTQSNASRHLTALKNSGILIGFKDAQWTYYRVNDRFVNENGELWEYLRRTLKELPTYQNDISQFLKCRGQGLCSNNQKMAH